MTKIHKKPIEVKTELKKISRSILGVTSSIRNLLIAIALLFAFLGGFFQVYNWVDSTYARRGWVQQIENKQEFKWESDVLTEMYKRFAVLDTLVRLSPDPKSVPELLKCEYDNYPGKIKLQEKKVDLLQKKLVDPEKK